MSGTCFASDIGARYALYHGDSVRALPGLPDSSIGLSVSSWPFSDQYAYSPSEADFGNCDGDDDFFAQMTYLLPDLLRVTIPGRFAIVHCKDRIIYGSRNGGVRHIEPFSDKVTTAMRAAGFLFYGRITVAIDPVRENNQTNNLPYSELKKDASRYGVGMPEYLLLFRKPPTSTEKSYADEPVVKSKEKYTRGRWQIDAHGFARSNGNRFMTPEELAKLPHEQMFKAYREFSLHNLYDFEHHVSLNDGLAEAGQLPVTFMLLQPQSWHPDVYTDITRMLTLNTAQSQRNKEMHLCPMQFDLADRVIAQFSNPGDVVFDPFGGLGTVPYRAIKAGRYGYMTELSAPYFADAVGYLAAMEREMAIPTLFDFMDAEELQAA